MFRSIVKRYLLIFIPCILIIGAMVPLAASAKSASSNQHHTLTAQSVVNTTYIVADGGFEKPVLGCCFNEYSAGQTFGSWRVTKGSIDLVDQSYWVPARGAQSVDLDGSDAGAIAQNLTTTAGTKYALTFAMAGNPVCGAHIMHMQVWWGSILVATLLFHTTNYSTNQMGWKYNTYTVKATSATTSLRFVSLTHSLCGPALDAVSVTVKA